MTLDKTYGSIDRRQIKIRRIKPSWFCDWDNQSYGWRISLKKLLNPHHWFKVVRNSESWSFQIRRFRGSNHRCYCSTGTSCDGRLVLFGFGLAWFYSNFTGDLPCHCDAVIDELERDNVKQSFEALRDASGGFWDDIDVDEFMRFEREESYDEPDWECEVCSLVHASHFYRCPDCKTLKPADL